MEGKYALDRKDLRILVELDRDTRQSNNQIGKKVGLSKEVVHYRINRMLEGGLIVRFHTVINYFKLGIAKFKAYLRLVDADKAKLEEIAGYFNRHRKTEWVALTTGRWDLIVGFLAHNANEFDDELQIALTKFSRYIQDKAVTTTLYLAHQTREFLSASSKPEKSRVVYHTSKDPQEAIDEIDRGILRLLANNARLPAVEIAHRLRTTPRVVQYRIKEMEKKKIILAYRTHLDSKRMGRIFCKAIIYLENITKERLEQFIAYSSNMPGAIWPQRVLGSWDFELDFELEDYDAFQDALLNLKEKFSDIIRSQEFCILSKDFKLDLFPEAFPALTQR
ncbi:winged helix-turn-helix transcriptional regulator [Candidatus Woesearchaeota archaeon]|nr:winged helix-turn-helix transcriptional regulator [Candidatus Woesearchaeota archaeon]